MINKTLLKQTVRANLPLFLIMTLIQAGMIVLLTCVGQGVQASGVTYYQMLPGILMGVYVIITANKLIAAQVDEGTMAYVLSTPVTRNSVAITQASFLFGSTLLMFAVTAGTHILTASLALATFSIGDALTILLLNLGLFALAVAFGGICFLASGWFNQSKNAIAVGGGVVGGFLLLSLVKLFSASLTWLGNLTIVSLYDINSIMTRASAFIPKLIILAAIGLVTYAVGVVVFNKRDLPL